MPNSHINDSQYLLDSIDIGIIVLTQDERVILWNQWVEERSSFSATKTINQRFFDLFPHLAQTRLREAISSVTERGQSCVLSRQLNPILFPLHDLSGGKIIQSLIIRPVKLEEGTGCLIQVRDETASAAREKMLLDNQEALNIARKDAVRANIAKSEFLANMSHELRTPLNAILGFSEILSGQLFGTISDRYKEYADDIHNSGQHLLDIINDILDLSKIEAGKMVLNPDRVDSVTLLDHVLRIVQARADDRHVSLERLYQQNPMTIWADSRLLKQSMLNLLSNAVKFTRAGGWVKISTSRTPSSFSISVEDNGIGMLPHEIPRMMQPFVQGESTINRNFEGTGLGLPLTKAMIELHGGTLHLISTAGVGTRVTIEIPTPVDDLTVFT